RTLMTIEEHGGGRQLVRFRWWPRPASVGLAATLGLAALAGVAAVDHAWIGCGVLAAGSCVLVPPVYQECPVATPSLADVLTMDRQRVAVAAVSQNGADRASAETAVASVALTTQSRPRVPENTPGGTTQNAVSRQAGRAR